MTTTKKLARWRIIGLATAEALARLTASVAVVVGIWATAMFSLFCLAGIAHVTYSAAVTLIMRAGMPDALAWHVAAGVFAAVLVLVLMRIMYNAAEDLIREFWKNLHRDG